MSERNRLLLALQISDLLLRFQLKRRSIRRAFPVGEVSISNAHILLHLDTDRECNARRIAQALNLEESTISRILASLEIKGLIKKTEAKGDKRAKLIALTARGRGVLDDLDRSQQFIMERCLAGLSNDEKKELAQLLKVVADGLGTPELGARLADDPITLQLRRIARGAGMLGDSFLGTSLSLIKYHILRCIDESPRSIMLRTLCEIIPFDPSTVSRTVTSLSNEGWVAIERSKADQRHCLISMSPEGRTRFSTYRSLSARRIADGTENQSFETLDRLVELLQRVDSSTETPRPLQDQLEVRRLTTEEERKRARAFLITRLVETDMTELLPQRVLSNEGVSYALEVDGEVKGVCALHLQGDHWLLDNLAVSSDLEDRNKLTKFLRSVFEDFFAQHGTERIFVDRSLPVTSPSSVGPKSLSRFTATPRSTLN